MPKNDTTTAIQRKNRQRLLDAATIVFTRDGYDKASIRSVAKQAAMTPGLVYYYFKTKDELLIAVQEHIQERYHELHTSSPQPESVEQQLDAIRSRVIDTPDWYRWRYELYALGLKRDDLRHEVAKVLDNGRQSVVKRLYPDVIADHQNAAALAAILIACFDGLALQKLTDEKFDINATYDTLLEVLENYMKAQSQEQKI
ncbi:TetR/AcrR family transcriptional regulator [bacterium]|nr:MAG: TetR/AcrR family transcriptional regulator [bacterium]